MHKDRAMQTGFNLISELFYYCPKSIALILISLIFCCRIMCLPSQIAEQCGAVRTIAEGVGGELLVGTTRNALLRGSFVDGFRPIIQVSSADCKPSLRAA